MSDTIADTIRYLLWCEQLPPEKHIAELARRTGLELGRVADILQGRVSDISSAECTAIADALHIPEDELQHSNFVEDAVTCGDLDMLKENLRYLIGTLEHGKQVQLATYLGVAKGTVSRWTHDDQRPRRTYLQKICRYFDLPADTDLEKHPIFLYDLPMNDQTRRAWLHSRIDQLTPETIRALFPALERLLREE